MKIAVSSLAWSPEQDDEVRSLLVECEVRGVELAPLKYWPVLEHATEASLAECRARWAESGVGIVALQGILFGLPKLLLFGTETEQALLEAHLGEVVRVASALGAGTIVLGAPSNRLRGALSEDEAVERAAIFLRRVGRLALDAGCVIGVEAAPVRYGGDFARSLREVRRLVDAAGHAGVGLHLDAGAIAIVGEDDETVRDAARIASHFHVSEIDLVPVGSGTVDHRHIAGLLRSAGYAGWCSLEMRAVAPGALISTLRSALDVARLAYGA